MIDPSESALSLRGAWRVLFRHRRKMVLVFGAVLGVTAALTLLTPRAYRSEAKLYLRLGRENAMLDPAATLGQAPVVTVPESRENEINSVIEVLRGRSLLEQVVDRVGAEVVLGEADLPADFTPGPPPQDAAARAEQAGRDRAPRAKAARLLARQLDVEAVKKSNVIQLRYDGPSPEVSQAVLATLTEFYLDRHVRLNRTPGGPKFLTDQTARTRDQLARSEQKLLEVQGRTGLFAPEEQQRLLVARLARLEDERLQAEASLRSAEAEVKALRARLAAASPTQVTGRTTGARNEAADGMRVQLYNLQLKEQELLSRHPAEHPEVRQLRRQVAAARALLEKEERDREQVTVGPSREYEELRLELARKEPAAEALKAKAESLRGQLDKAIAGVKALNEDRMRFDDLKREAEMQSARYRKYADALEQAQIDRALQAERISNVSIVEPATFDAVPVRPRRLLYLAAGLLLAVLASLGAAWLAEYLDHPARTADDIEKRLGLSALAEIPAIAPRPPVPQRS